MENNLLSFEIFVSEAPGMPLLSTDYIIYTTIYIMVPAIAFRDSIFY